MAPSPDITGQRFARLTAIERGPNTGENVQWWCQCDCGNRTLVRASYLRTGHTRSCGCLRREAGERQGPDNIVHGHRANSSRSPTYHTWLNMIARCDNPSAISYRYYGARGITVCERWRNFENFLADMGERPPGKTIDRKDNDKGYEPGNCRWATPAEQVANRRPRPLED